MKIIAGSLFGNSAVFSDCERYRYSLERIWNEERPRCAFVMLNPSTADATVDDPTVRKCIGFASRWGYGGIEVVNIFAWRATDPTELKTVEDPIGPDNDRFIIAATKPPIKVVAAWGQRGTFGGRGRKIMNLLTGLRVKQYALKINGDGTPAHPLYMNYLTELIRFKMDEKRIQRLNAVKIKVIQAARAELDKGDISAMEVLAVLAYCVGQCIALQDMTKVTSEMAMELVAQNIEAGNMDVLIRLPRPKG